MLVTVVNCIFNRPLAQGDPIQDIIHVGDLVGFGNGRTVSMVQFSAEERSRVPLAALLSLTMKAYGCEYDDHATSGPLAPLLYV